MEMKGIDNSDPLPLSNRPSLIPAEPALASARSIVFLTVESEAVLVAECDKALTSQFSASSAGNRSYDGARLRIEACGIGPPTG
jgi:hypothetical protein